jgi:PAS domain-containing serine/threonine kinase
LSSNCISEISELFKSTSLDTDASTPSSDANLLPDSKPIYLSHLSQHRPFGREAFPSLSSQPGPPPGYTYNREADRHSFKFPRGHCLNLRFVESYQLEDELGSGGYGFVMTARHRASGREVAVKFIIKAKVPDHAWMEDELLGQLPAEVVLLQRLSHPNIIKSLDLFEDDLYFYLVSLNICRFGLALD